ncbi:hypothetical protein [Hydrogenophaga sp.]|uniref:hypothetical protein n=1 Tax=Hydrogenophaga sp. TaxID=1904254 RepID=UPI003D096901
MRSSSNTRHWPAEGLEARALTVAAAIVGSSVVGGVMSADAAGDAASTAAGAQTAASEAGIAEQRRQFEAVRKLLEPYVQAGTDALGGQKDLAGLNGNTAQDAAIQALQGSPQFTSLLARGENSILQNASATGGLRGGNTQAALAQFSPALLAQTINDQYTRLGGLTSLGQNAAAGVGNAGLQTGDNIADLLSQIGSAQAGGALAAGRAQSNMWSSLGGAAGAYYGLQGKF